MEIPPTVDAAWPTFETTSVTPTVTSVTAPMGRVTSPPRPEYSASRNPFVRAYSRKSESNERAEIGPERLSCCYQAVMNRRLASSRPYRAFRVRCQVIQSLAVHQESMPHPS